MLVQNGSGSNGNERVLHILQSPSIIGTSSSDRLVLYPVLYPGHSWGALALCRGALGIF